MFRKKQIIIIVLVLVLFAYSIPALMMIYDIKTMIRASAESEFDDISQFSALFIYLSSG
jgi:hypothetical protein